MKKIIKIFILLLAIVMIQAVSGQGLSNYQNRVPGMNLLMYLLNATPAPDLEKSYLNLYVQVSNDLLQFVRRDSIYTARYDLTVSINQKNGQSLATKISNGSVSAQSFESTNARNIHSYEKFRFELPPGNYQMYLELVDLETQQPFIRREDFEIADFRKTDLNLNEIVFFQSPNRDTSAVFPSIPPARTSPDNPFFAEYTIVSEPSVQLKISQKIVNVNRDTVFRDVRVVESNYPLKTVKLVIPDNLAFGRYNLLVQLSDGVTTSYKSAEFYIRWGLRGLSLMGGNETFEAIQYIMDHKDWSALRSLSDADQLTRLERFWSERDPEPATEINELEEEFVRRVSYTNQNFSTGQDSRDGWRTDRGRIYIVYGAPTNIEKPTTSQGQMSLYEVWFYAPLSKRFVFMQRFGADEYVLISEE